jgi:hypothetical protein
MLDILTIETTCLGDRRYLAHDGPLRRPGCPWPRSATWQPRVSAPTS